MSGFEVLAIMACVVGGVVSIACVIWFGGRAWDVASDCDWSYSVWKAKGLRDKARHEKMVYYLGLGFNVHQARERAGADLNKEAAAAAAAMGDS